MARPSSSSSSHPSHLLLAPLLLCGLLGRPAQAVQCTVHTCTVPHYDKPGKDAIACGATPNTCTNQLCCEKRKVTLCVVFTCPTLGWKPKPDKDTIVCGATLADCITGPLSTCCYEVALCSKRHSCSAGFTAKTMSSSIECPAPPVGCTDAACCDELMCAPHVCSLGFRDKPGKATLSCGGVCTDNTCCESSTCAGYACPAGSTAKPNPMSIQCGATCAPMTCCDEVMCDTFTCPQGYADKPGKAAIACGAVCAKEKCCDLMCDSFTCPGGFTAKPNPATIKCGGTCAPMTCCDEVMCDTFSCPPTYADKAGKAAIPCGGVCAKEKCCDLMCDSFTCPAGFTAKPNPAIIKCGGTCAPMTCCDEVMCDTFTCPPTYADKAGKATIPCGGVCAKEKCCDLMCDTFTCPAGFTAKPNPATIKCGATCAPMTCCDEVMCDTFTCPQGYADKSGKAAIACGAVCAKDTCCDLMCDSFTCPADSKPKPNPATIKCDGACADACCDRTCDLFSCPAGFNAKPNPATIQCGAACIEATCCDQVLCGAFACPSGFADKPGKATIGCAAAKCVAAECCREILCDTHACGTGLTDKPGKGSVVCGTLCTNDVCCDPLTCKGYGCPAGFGDKAGKAGIPCGAVCSNGACCDKLLCASFSCPAGYLAKPNSAAAPCGGPCTPATCCDGAVMCDAHTCAVGTLAAAAATTLCGHAAADCYDTLCCDPPPRCGAYTCVASDMVRKTGFAGITCSATGSCNDATCCERRCHVYTCTSGASKAGAADLLCGAACTDVFCCDPPVKCDAYSCASPVAVLKKDFARILCGSNPGACDDAKCCEVHCDRYACKEGLPKAGAVDIFCGSALAGCSDALCCDPPAKCDAYVCVSPGTVLKTGFQHVACGQQAASCTDAVCCEARCDAHTCASGVAKQPAAGIVCVAGAGCTDAVCCDPPVKCDAYVCASSDAVLKNDFARILCGNNPGACTDAVCCEVFCSRHTCKEGVHKKTARDIGCGGAAVDTCSDTLCCDPPVKCGAYVCVSPGAVLKTGFDHVECGGGGAACDDAQCCEARCSSHACSSGSPKPGSAGVACGGAAAACTDAQCCDPGAKCDGYVCAAVDGSLKTSFDRLFCASSPPAVCDDAACCDLKCGSYACSAGFLSRPGGALTPCPGACTDAACCDRAPLCSAHACGAGLRVRPDKSDAPCVAAGGCTDAACCDAATCDGFAGCAPGFDPLGAGVVCPAAGPCGAALCCAPRATAAPGPGQWSCAMAEAVLRPGYHWVAEDVRDRGCVQTAGDERVAGGTTCRAMTASLESQCDYRCDEDTGRWDPADCGVAAISKTVKDVVKNVAPWNPTKGGVTALLSNVACKVEDLDLDAAEPLDWEFHPVGLPIGIHAHRYFLGAVVWNTALMVCAAALLMLLAALQMWMGDCTYMHALGNLRTPGILYVPFFFLIPGTLLSAAHMAFNARQVSPVVAALGWFVLVVLGCSPLVLYHLLLRPSVLHARTAPDPRISSQAQMQAVLQRDEAEMEMEMEALGDGGGGGGGGANEGAKAASDPYAGNPAAVHNIRLFREGSVWRRMYIFIFGYEIWVSTKGRFVWHYGAVFESLKEGRTWFPLLDLGQLVGMCLFASWKTSDKTKCLVRNLLITAVLVAYFSAICFFRPYIAVFENIVSFIISLLMVLAMVLMTIAMALDAGSRRDSLYGTAGVVLVAITFLVAFKALYDLVTFVWDMKVGRRRKVQQQYHNKAEEEAAWTKQMDAAGMGNASCANVGGGGGDNGDDDDDCVAIPEERRWDASAGDWRTEAEYHHRSGSGGGGGGNGGTWEEAAWETRVNESGQALPCTDFVEHRGGGRATRASVDAWLAAPHPRGAGGGAGGGGAGGGDSSGGALAQPLLRSSGRGSSEEGDETASALGGVGNGSLDELAADYLPANNTGVVFFTDGTKSGYGGGGGGGGRRRGLGGGSRVGSRLSSSHRGSLAAFPSFAEREPLSPLFSGGGGGSEFDGSSNLLPDSTSFNSSSRRMVGGGGGGGGGSVLAATAGGGGGRPEREMFTASPIHTMSPKRRMRAAQQKHAATQERESSEWCQV